MKKQLKLSSQPLIIQPEFFKPPQEKEQQKKKPLQNSFFERLRDEVNKYEYVKNNEYFKLNFDIEKMKTFSKAWDMYRKLKAKAHEVVQSGFEMYKNCSKKQIDSSLEAVINTYNSIKQKEANQVVNNTKTKNHDDADTPPTPPAIQPQQQLQPALRKPPPGPPTNNASQVVWRMNKTEEQEKLDHKSLCDWLYTNLNDATKNKSIPVSEEEQILSKQRHEYFNETIPAFIKKTKQKIYYADLTNQDKKLVDKISKGYEPQQSQSK